MTNQIVPSNHGVLANASLVHEFAERLKLMVNNGRNLNDNEAMALAQYAVATDLNPFLSECYYLQGIGPGPGIAGWRKKAEEQLEYEAKRAAEPLARFWVDYVDPEPNEVSLSGGDIGVKVILHDTLTKNAWEKRTLSHYIQLVSNGIKENAWETAQSLAGPEPTWSAVGIVRQGENFGGDKMPRYERACKRGEKAALRKRFTRIHLPEPMGFDESDIVESTFVATPAEQADRVPPPLEQPAKANGSGANPLQSLVDAGVCQNMPAAAGLVNNYAPSEIRGNAEKLLAWGKLYRAWRDRQLETDEAAAKATAGEQPE